MNNDDFNRDKEFKKLNQNAKTPFTNKLTRKQFDREIMESLKDIKDGNVLTFDEFVKEANSWG